MPDFAIDPRSPLARFQSNFLQQFITRFLLALSQPGALEGAALDAHDDAAIHLLESLNPATTAELILAGHFGIAHYAATACAQSAFALETQPRDAPRLLLASATLTRTMIQALNAMQRCQAPPRRHTPVPGGTDTAEPPPRHISLVPSEQAAGPTSPAAGALPRPINPMHREPSPQPALRLVRPERAAPQAFRIEDHVKYEALYRPDGTRWHGPPACWPGPSWLADRFPLTDEERKAEWRPRAWDEMTMEQKRAAWGYGVTAADYTRAAAERATAAGPRAPEHDAQEPHAT